MGVVEDGGTADEDGLDALAEAMRVGIGGGVAPIGRGKKHEVGVVALFEGAALCDAEGVGRETGHPVDGGFRRKVEFLG